ncbi:hypothetical protein B0H21DRAFT_733867 [Amylocystis lapponica]|nr:hypothetical protein B0H21DRAFT_733867 [Amylocystis lapponica]
MQAFDEVTYPVQLQLSSAIAALPKLTRDQVPLEEACPICLVPFAEILQAVDDAAAPSQFLIPNCVTRLDRCGHMFCRDDMVQWISNWRGTCPACRDVFLDIYPPSESDNESSDGDYVPGEDEEEEEEEEEEDGFFDGDGFEDTEDEFEVDRMDMEVFAGFGDIAADIDEWMAGDQIAAPAMDIAADLDAWFHEEEARRRRDRSPENMGLSDGSESVSEVELVLENFNEGEGNLLPESPEAVASYNVLLEYTRSLDGSRANSEEPSEEPK